MHSASLKSPGYKSSPFHMAQAGFKLCTHWKDLYIVFLNAFPLLPEFINHIVTSLSCLFPPLLFFLISQQGEGEEKKPQPNRDPIFSSNCSI